jgi:hypothetical protein
METELKMHTPEYFNTEVKKLTLNMPLLEAIITYCDREQLEYETVKSLISVDLKRKLRKEAEDLNFIPTTSKLPL